MTEHRLKQVREAQARYRLKHPEKVREYREWYLAEHAEKHRDIQRRAAARKRAKWPLYTTWQHIKQRCLNPAHCRYKDYGGRGITVYKDWIQSYAAFETYILSTLGPKPNNKSLDRINNDKGYFPGNLRWASPIEQRHNRRR